jgi:hypothetical protein
VSFYVLLEDGTIVLQEDASALVREDYSVPAGPTTGYSILLESGDEVLQEDATVLLLESYVPAVVTPPTPTTPSGPGGQGARLPLNRRGPYWTETDDAHLTRLLADDEEVLVLI